MVGQRWRSSRRGRGTRRSLREAFEEFSVLFDDLADASRELGVLPAALDRFSESELHGLVEALSLSARERVGVGSEFVVEANCQVLRRWESFRVSRLASLGFRFAAPA